MSLEELINKCKSGERNAQEQLYRLYAGKLFGVCLKYSRNKEEAEDNLQDSFLTIFKKIQQFTFKGSFEGWLRRVTVNTVLQKYRKDGVFDIINDDIPEEVEVEIDEDEVSLDYLLKLIQELPDRYRLTFSMYVLDGFSHKEIAKMLNISEGTSKSNLARARGILKNKIEEKDLKKKVNSL
ncbi:RNA polymerase sigma factor [Abyssalbus ytuae]|uniref:RNA polymerase sigma factor n=1 Tax=Abyssalbus ytuae TaxID=2926907 RepID=A0A9E7CXU6_9FLAO|nr:RNA polymerase sigma factor [Abyssalbus ytuae]UOB15955.1 RNA polymerase sigma factor [Abyssalbus ytuae]